MKVSRFGRLALAVVLFGSAALAGAQEQAQEQAPAPAKPELPKRLSGTVPEYPDAARSFNVHGTVLVRLTVGKSGKVDKTEILESPADILSEAVTRSVADWKFTKPEEPTPVQMKIPFVLTGDDEAFDMTIRPMQSAPKSKDDLKKKIADGWSEVRIIIDKAGAVASSLVIKMSDPGFRQTNDAIVAALKFAPVPEGTPAGKSTTLNAFRISVTERSKIEVSQSSGE